MRKNQHLEALVRLYALQLAIGHKQRAEVILKWAYSNTFVGNDEGDTESDGDYDTDWFIGTFLRAQDKIARSEVRKFMRSFVREPDKYLDYEKISDHIKDMEYNDFLKTTYWKGVALAVKERDGKKCAICGGTDNLSAHHLTYRNHGDEIHHLEDLQCVCQRCHERLHGINGKDKEQFATT